MAVAETAPEPAPVLPVGARWHRVALQVNPYEYKGAGEPSQSFADEDAYNHALVEELLAMDISLIGVTDHWRVDKSLELISRARQSGIVALPGFEAVSSEGIHVLVLFDENADAARVNAAIGVCGAHPDCPSGKTGEPFASLLQAMHDRGALTVAAHVTGPNGLLEELHGQALATAWKSPCLSAVAVQPDDPPSALQQDILDNKVAEYKRPHVPAILAAGDVTRPDGLRRPGATSWVKMSRPALESLKLATRTPDTRVRREEPLGRAHPVVTAISWEGGFLDGVRLPLSESMTCLVGGRGTGKSTVVESIRYALGVRPIGEAAQRDHRSVVERVLEPGAKVSVHFEASSPAVAEFLVERTVPHLPVLRDSAGTVLASTPLDVLGTIDVFGQHELAELAESMDLVAEVLRRFVGDVADVHDSGTARALRKNREAILELRHRIVETEAALDELPRLREELRRYRESGLDERLADQAHVQREERVLETADARLRDVATAAEPLHEQSLFDKAFVSAAALSELPRAQTLTDIGVIIGRLQQRVDSALGDLDQAVDTARGELGSVRSSWTVEVAELKNTWDQVLRDLQRGGLEAGRYLETQRAVEQLTPLEQQAQRLRLNLTARHDERRQLLAEHEDTQAAATHRLREACRRANEALQGVVRVRPRPSPDRAELLALIGEFVSGQRARIKATIERDDFSPRSLAAAARSGAEALAELGITGAQADSLARADEELFLRLEEMTVVTAAEASLNLGESGGQDDWRVLADLSKGQKATALLLMLLATSTAPLIIDQPEDDLDNRFIVEGVVPRLRELKDARQLVFTTHNANIPVLGDAELIAVFEAGAGRGTLADDGVGSLDDACVREQAEQILEGGKDAFAQRRRLYGF